MTADNAKTKILLCEDDTNLGLVLKKSLEHSGYEVVLERDGRLGLAAFKREKFDFCLIDVMMPNVDGFTVAEEIRDINPDIPLFFVTAKTMRDDVIKGYNLGADDYITKPFDMDVLLLKIKVNLKKNEEKQREDEITSYDLGRYHFNPSIRELSIDGKKNTLSPKENDLLKMLSEYKNRSLSRESALKKIWGSNNYFNGRSMDVYIAKLRKLLKDDPNITITNIHGQGFMLEEKQR